MRGGHWEFGISLGGNSLGENFKGRAVREMLEGWGLRDGSD